MTFWNSPRYYLNCTVQSWSCNRFSLAVCCLLFLYNDFSNGPKSESSQQFGLMSSDPSFPTANSSNKFTFTFHYYLEITLKTCLGILRIGFTILFSRFSRTFAAAEEYGKNERFLLTSLAWLVPYPSSLTSAVNRIYSLRHFQRSRFWKKRNTLNLSIFWASQGIFPSPRPLKFRPNLMGHLFCSLFFCCLGRVFSWSFIGSKGEK